MVYWISPCKQDKAHVNDIVQQHFSKCNQLKAKEEASSTSASYSCKTSLLNSQWKNIPASVKPALACYFGHNAKISDIFVICHQFLEGSKALQSSTVSSEVPAGTGIFMSLWT